MPLPAGLLKTVLALEELHDFTREFTATGWQAHIPFLLKRRLHKRLSHVKLRTGKPFSFAIEAIIFAGGDRSGRDVVS